MPYHGYIEVHVRLLRQGHGTDSSGEPGSGYGVEFERTVRIEEREARDIENILAGPTLGKVQKAIKRVLDESDMDELQQRWRDATENLDADAMRRALAAIEGRDPNPRHIRVADLPLTPRTVNCLMRAGIETVEQLLPKSRRDLNVIPNMGEQSQREVFDYVTQTLGIRWPRWGTE